MNLYQAQYYANYLTLQNPNTGTERLGAALMNATIDLNPHQVKGALFFFDNPLNKWVLLADEVGLGKTIEAWLVLCQLRSELKRKIILIVPASLRKQRQAELSEKFFLPAEIVDGKTYREFKKTGIKNPFDQNKIIITSYQFAAKSEKDIVRVGRNLAVIDEAHNLRNVYKNPQGTAATLLRLFKDTKKLLLTATPLQNTALELYGLMLYLDDYVFWDKETFKKNFSSLDTYKLQDLKARLKPFMNRTLRSQVKEYICYTKRIPTTYSFTPTPEELELYEQISAFLQREELKIISTKTKHLVILVLRKLLASSTRAIASTLDMMIQKIEEWAALEQVIDDEDLLDEYQESIDDPEEQQELVENLKQFREELDELKGFRQLAYTIGVDSKTKKLQEALKASFSKLQEMWANKKALIFTGFRKTQEYLKSYLEAHGYEGKIVLFNGSNDDAHSQWIYRNRLERHKGTEKITGSKSSDMKAALVEYFKEEAEVMIATESAAEGVNLQFCSLLINYDLPWNPQRVEQRIGRCHRYGQKNDVLVINFLNENNYADQRVFELLSEKFNLFKEVFDASDGVLGELGDGFNLEQKILNIYQTCRTHEEIDAAYQELVDALKPQIESHIQEVKQTVLKNFDEEVISRLKNIQQKGLAQLDLSKRVFWNLTSFALEHDASFDQETFTFDLHHPLDFSPSYIQENAPTLSHIPAGRYTIDRTREDAYFHRPQAPLGAKIIAEHLDLNLEPAHVVFYPDRYHNKLGALQELKGTSGYLYVQRLTIHSADTEEYLVASCIDQDGKKLDPDLVRKLMLVPSELRQPVHIPPSLVQTLEQEMESVITKTIEEVMERNFLTQEEQLDKIERRSNDLIQAKRKETDELREEIRIKRRALGRTIDKVILAQLNEEIILLTNKLKEKEKRFDIDQHEIDKQEMEIIMAIKERLSTSEEKKPLFMIQRTIM